MADTSVGGSWVVGMVWRAWDSRIPAWAERVAGTWAEEEVVAAWWSRAASTSGVVQLAVGREWPAWDSHIPA